MPAELIASVRRLSDAELVARLEDLAAGERRLTAELVAHLAELETRSLHLQAGYGSLFAYCREALQLSEHECYNRIEVARAVRRYPVILERLASGEVNLTTVRLLAPHLTAENHLCTLDEARGKKRSAIEEMVARLAPWPDAPVSIRKLPAPRVVSVTVPLSPASGIGDERQSPAPAAAAKPAAIVPLSPDRYKLQVTIAGETLEKLRLAKDMLRHALPTGDEAQLLDRALTSLLADLARRRFAATERPRPASASNPDSRHIPAEVRRVVWLRDLGRCAFVAQDGRRCSERAFLEFHHLRPYAAGGEATVANIQLRCRGHNDYEERVFFDDREPRSLSSR